MIGYYDFICLSPSLAKNGDIGRKTQIVLTYVRLCVWNAPVKATADAKYKGWENFAIFD